MTDPTSLRARLAARVARIHKRPEDDASPRAYDYLVADCAIEEMPKLSDSAKAVILRALTAYHERMMNETSPNDVGLAMDEVAHIAMASYALGALP